MRFFHILGFLAFCSVTFSSQAQIVGSNQFPNTYRMPGGYAFIEPNTDPSLKSVTEPRSVQGSPFLFEEAVPSKIIFTDSDEESIDLELNYNAYADFMKIKDEATTSSDIELLPRGWNYDILMGERRFRFINFTHNKSEVNTHVEIVETFDDGSFLAIQWSKVIQEIFPGKDRYVSSQRYYLINTDGRALQLKNDNTIIDALPKADQDKIKEYITNNNIRFTKDLRGLKGVAKYYVSLN
ncbi:hypothetical protein [Nonlabens marinus]|uniref:Uncharacterized protein n=1 Tax=Nonlabens marinus S1-08 TaxID=1454201 RepID=W8VUJ7_9FLAO|nr:hypothetical protein [Nonlabens marinus]BAO54658.1 hypothetical protein NMS_0649 [Nonlabens marinus S1-08]